MTLSLTDTEQQILHLVAHGYARKEIAHHLARSEHTIATHYHHIKLKLSARTLEHAVALAITRGMVAIDNKKGTAD